MGLWLFRWDEDGRQLIFGIAVEVHSWENVGVEGYEGWWGAES